MSNEPQTTENSSDNTISANSENGMVALTESGQPTHSVIPSQPLVAEIQPDDLPPEIREAFFPSQDKSAEIIVELPTDRALPVFNVAELRDLSMRNDAERAEHVAAMNFVIEQALKKEGRREIPNFITSEFAPRLHELARAMPNFSEVVDYLLHEIGYSSTGDLNEFRVEPLLLVGGPGEGKTRFASEVAKAIDVEFERISLSGVQSSADLCGTARHWSNTRPGRIARILAASKNICPVVLLDEVDKTSDDSRFPVMPSLLELLELDSARTYRDESMEIRMDTSHVIYIATANDLEKIDLPLRSRFRIFHIKSPSQAQRRVIVENILKELIGKRGIVVGDGVIDAIASMKVDLRELRRLLREGLGRACVSNEECLRIDHLRFAADIKQRSIGFIQ